MQFVYIETRRIKCSECNPSSMPYKEIGTISAIYDPIFNELLMNYYVRKYFMKI
jgi:hypothetical protein